MCRFLAYRGSPVVLDELLYQPDHSLIKQSFKSREREEPLNGDGFGLGWYAREIDSTPAVYRSIQPAWNDKNLLSLARKIRSDCFFAHIRAASVGDVTRANCHPFASGDLLFMHNGLIKNFAKIKRELQRRLSDEVFATIDGQTDSEHFFALLMNNLTKEQSSLSARVLANAVLAAISEMNEIKRTLKVEGFTHLNIAVTDGSALVATRYTSDPEAAPPSLYYALAEKVQCEDGEYRVINPDEQQAAVLVVSERLNDRESDWHRISENHLLLVDEKTPVTVEEIAA